LLDALELCAFNILMEKVWEANEDSPRVSIPRAILSGNRGIGAYLEQSGDGNSEGLAVQRLHVVDGLFVQVQFFVLAAPDNNRRNEDCECRRGVYRDKYTRERAAVPLLLLPWA
jgi:hypothetical protein